MKKSDRESSHATKARGNISGSSSLSGYEYQIDVAVWIALDVVLANKFSQEISLEPASQEDMEAEIDNDEPGKVSSVASIDGYTLVVQAKMRSKEVWTVSRMKSLLQHGSKRRQSAAMRLSTPKVRYLLVTNAALTGKMHGLKVRRACLWPDPATMPASIAKTLPTGSAGRVAVIGNEDDERLETDINKLLTESFRVPNAGWKACLKNLREEARFRIAGGGSGRWRRDELEEVIRTHQGYIASSPELENYVSPEQLEEITGRYG